LPYCDAALDVNAPPAARRWLFSLFFAAKYQSSLYLVQSPGGRPSTLPEVHETRTLWQF
jgi:hypothetical protein